MKLHYHVICYLFIVTWVFVGKVKKLFLFVHFVIPFVWPFVTAFGLALLAAGLVTQPVISVIGLLLALRGAVGWFRDVLPVEQHELVRLRPLEQRARAIAPAPRAVAQLTPGVAGHRVRIPAEIHPYSSGIKGEPARLKVS